MKLINILFFVLLICFAQTFYAQPSKQKQTYFVPAEVWKDTNDKPINAHGGGVIFFEGKYYWYGEYQLEGKSESEQADGGISCYSSEDLINWKNEGVVLSVDYQNETSDLAYGCILERPKVVYNEKNKEFVVFFKLYLKGVGYVTSNVGVAIAKSPNGPFVYHHRFLGAGSVNGSGDFSMFTDDDGSLYHLAVRKPDKVFVIAKMDSNFYYPAADYGVCEGIQKHTEAPAVIKRNGVYYMLSSGSTGFAPNLARYYTAKNILGKWDFHGTPCTGFNKIDKLGANKTYGGQSCFIIPIQHKADAYIAMFDIWQPENPISGRYIWLPINFVDNKMTIDWLDKWNLKQFDKKSKTK